jgi:putative transposase
LELTSTRVIMVPMSIYRRFSGHGLPYFVTTNTAHRRPIFTDPAAIAALIQVLNEVRAETRFRLHAYVLMPDHLHFVTATPERIPIGRVIGLVKGRFAHRWNRRTGTSGSVWQSRFRERALRTAYALRSAIDYVHLNPVEAGLVTDPTMYEWSSAKWWADRPG